MAEGHGRWREKAMTLSRSRGRSDTQGHVGARAGRSGLEVSFGGLRGCPSRVSFGGVVVLHFKLKGFDEAMQKRQGRYLLD